MRLDIKNILGEAMALGTVEGVIKASRSKSA